MNAVSLPSATASAWRRAGPVLALLALAILLLYRETALAMASIWARSDTFAHGFLVPPISLWLIWRQRAQLARYTPSPSAWGLLPLAGGAVLWLLADLVSVNSVTQLALVTMLVSAVPTVLGWQIARAMMFPLGFLFFAVPIGEFMMPLLMLWTADFTVLALRLSGIPVYREGLNFVIPSGNWSVVEACSGVRYLIASLTVGTLFAYLNYSSNRRRWAFVGVSLLVPIVANWLRAYMIVMLGHYSGNKLAVGVDHLVYGWLFFGVVIALMFFVGSRWSQPERPAVPVVTPAHAAAGRGAWVIAAAVATLCLPAIIQWRLASGAEGGQVNVQAPEQLADGWKKIDEAITSWRPSIQNPSGEVVATYAKGAQKIGVYVGYFRHQNYERKLVNSEHVLVRPKDPNWERVVDGTVAVKLSPELPALRGAQVRPLPTSLASLQRVQVWQIYWVGGRFTASDYLAKAIGAVYRLLGQGDDSAVVMFFASEEHGAQADSALRTFAQSANFAAIDAWLRQTGTAP